MLRRVRNVPRLFCTPESTSCRDSSETPGYENKHSTSFNHILHSSALRSLRTARAIERGAQLLIGDGIMGTSGLAGTRPCGILGRRLRIQVSGRTVWIDQTRRQKG
jgi:hypothetical protein